MNYFNKEIRIIEELKSVCIFDVSFLNISYPLFRFFLSLVSNHRSSYWIDNSSKNLPPPDFYNDKDKLMLEVMRIDDFEEGSNSPSALESQAYFQLEKSMREHGKTLKNLTVLINPSRENVSDNNIRLYFDNFKRIIEKHAGKTDSYRNTHRGYKLGFLIFDESPAYVETQEKFVVSPHSGDITKPSRVYHAPYDKRFIDVLLNTDVDYVIWMTPYKWFPGNPRFTFKSVYLLDVNKAKKKRIKVLTEYKYDAIICLESE